MHGPPAPLRRRAAAALAAASLGVNAGCYSYHALPASDATPGTELRVILGGHGAPDLARLLGPRAASLEGRVVARTDSGVTLAVTTITRTTGVEESWPGDEVMIPRSAVASSETRRLAAGRSLALTALVVGAAAVVGAAIRASGDVNRGGPRTPGGGRQ